MIVESPPLVDPHSLLQWVTFSFLLEVKIGQVSGASYKGATDAFEKEETWNKYEITIQIHIESNEKKTKLIESPPYENLYLGSQEKQPNIYCFADDAQLYQF